MIEDQSLPADVEVRNVAGMLHGTPLRQIASMWTLASSWDPQDVLLTLGADMMDGGYGGRLAARRWRVSEVAAVCGLETRVLGFSWSDDANRLARGAAVQACSRGTTPYLRDPISLSRASRDGLSGARASMDVVFSHHFDIEDGLTPRVEALLSSLTDGGSEYAIVNVSALILRRRNILFEYAKVVDLLLRRGLSVLLLPHVFEPGCSDADALRSMERRYSASPRVRLVDFQMTPQEVFSVCSSSRVVVSGRMHLGVLALSSGTPAIVISTQGKVEGLMAQFREPAWSVALNDEIGEALLNNCRDVLRNRESVQSVASELILAARVAALRNFEDL